MTKDQSQPNNAYLFQVDLLVSGESNALALEKLLHELNKIDLMDYKITAGSQLGSLIDGLLALQGRPLPSQQLPHHGAQPAVEAAIVPVAAPAAGHTAASAVAGQAASAAATGHAVTAAAAHAAATHATTAQQATARHAGHPAATNATATHAAAAQATTAQATAKHAGHPTATDAAAKHVVQAAAQQSSTAAKDRRKPPSPGTAKAAVGAETHNNAPAPVITRIKEYIASNRLIRVHVNKGMGVKLSIPCRIINFDEQQHNLTVYHVDEKQVYTFNMFEIDDFNE